MKLGYIMRRMNMDDIQQVLEIDALSFPNPWSRRTYQHEVESSNTAQMIVIEAPTPLFTSLSPLSSLVRRWWGTPQTQRVLGYGGCWLIAGEAHISTIAVHPEFRGKGLGELLLMGMLKRAINLQADYSVLEVRVSNSQAQALYDKYEYKKVGRRKRYYRDNGEDALLMEARPLDEAYQQRLTERAHSIQERIPYIDRFTAIHTNLSAE